MASSDTKHDYNMEAGLLSTHGEERMLTKEAQFQDSELTNSRDGTRTTSCARRALIALAVVCLVGVGLVSLGHGVCPGHLRHAVNGDISVKDAIHSHKPNLSDSMARLARRQDNLTPGASSNTGSGESSTVVTEPTAGPTDASTTDQSSETIAQASQTSDTSEPPSAASGSDEPSNTNTDQPSSTAAQETTSQEASTSSEDTPSSTEQRSSEATTSNAPSSTSAETTAESQSSSQAESTTDSGTSTSEAEPSETSSSSPSETASISSSISTSPPDTSSASFPSSTGSSSSGDSLSSSESSFSTSDRLSSSESPESTETASTSGMWGPCCSSSSRSRAHEPRIPEPVAIFRYHRLVLSLRVRLVPGFCHETVSLRACRIIIMNAIC
ncbi:hypothetical protein AUP68_14705 [Ilyonectria robusta]